MNSTEQNLHHRNFGITVCPIQTGALMNSTSTLFAAAILSLSPAVSYAANYNIAVCSFHERPNHSGWDEMFSTGNTENLQPGQSTGLPGLTTSSDAICGIGIANGDASALAVTWSAASGSGINVDRNCVFSGQGLALTTTQATIKAGATAFIDHKFGTLGLVRTAVYLGLPGEAATKDWFEPTCQALGKRMAPSAP
jgi:hypothetical protein